MLLLAAPASAQQGTSSQPRLVTIAARSCPSYTAVTANRARNNIQESLEDLGPDTPYGSGSINVDPAVEAASQPTCTAIANWVFTLGTGIAIRDAVPPEPWGRLSYVTGPFSPTIVTQSAVPLLNSTGQATGATIDGATTIALTEEQSKLAAQSSKLWIQGGTKADPITDDETYAFGALRCATDNLNGDNVEWISYPPAATHVFCFAYYVKPAPSSGTITVVKDTTLPPDTAPQKVRFTGDISYENGEFFLTASNGKPGRQTFVRAGGRAWNFTEELTDLGTLKAIDCVSKTSGSTFDTNVGSGTTVVQLAAGDDVTCTYRNRFRPPPSGLTLRKVSTGGTGRFAFDIQGQGDVAEFGVDDASATTDDPGVATLVDPADEIADLPAGTYSVAETLPPDVGGKWTLDHVTCDRDGAESARDGDSAEIIVVRGKGTVCTFYNRFTPAGQITLRKVTLGGTATTRFQVQPQFGEPRPEREQIARTTEPGVAVRATGDDLDGLPIGTYAIQETISGPDRWEVASVVCNGRPYPAVGGRFTIELTDGEPALDCTVANKRIDDIPPEPPVPPQPPQPPLPPVEVGPEGGVAGEGAQSPVAELRVTKRVVPRRVRIGGRVRYLIGIVNRGPDPAKNVTLSEPGISPRGGRLPLRPSKGTCRNRPPRHCDFGTLKPGQRVTLRVRVTTQRTGRFVNRVAVNTSTQQRTMRGKRARASVLVRPLAPPSFTG